MSFAFVKLQRLVQGFDELQAGATPTQAGVRAALRLAGQLGPTALPLCLRELASSDARRVRWAEVLLAHLAAQPALRERVVAELRALAASDGAGADAAPGRARRMLAELGEPVSAAGAPDPVSSLGARLGAGGAAGRDPAPPDPDRLRVDMARMSTPADVAQVADRMLSALDPLVMVHLVDELGESDPARALRLADELLLRNELDVAIRQALRGVRAPLGITVSAVRPADAPAAASGPLAAALLGRHAGGRMVVIVSRPVVAHPGERPQRVRVMAMLLGADGMLGDGLYSDDLAARALDRELLAPLRQRGYRFAAAAVGQAAELVREGARAALCLGRALPRAFYLGRDLLGIHDEHAAGLRVTDEDGPLLDRGLQLLGEGLVTRARPLLERYVRRVPDNAEGRAVLGRCLLALGALELARAQMIQAIALDPDNPLHHWNMAAIAHRQGRQGGCYLALLDYLDLVGEGAFDAGAGACDARLETARAFVHEYERLARTEHPEARPAAVARAEDLAHRAQQRLSEAEARSERGAGPAPGARSAGSDAGHAPGIEAAVALLEQSVALVPTYHLAWTQLGLIFDRSGRRDEAERCLRRALALRPGDAAVLGALAALDRPDPGRGESRQLH